MSRKTQHTAIVQHHPDGSKTIHLGASSSGSLPVGAACSSDSDCSNNACGRENAGVDASKVCCPYGGPSETYAGYSYCTNMPNGNHCFSDAMCASQICSSNGICVSSLPNGAQCSSSSSCASGYCAPQFSIPTTRVPGICQPRPRS